MKNISTLSVVALVFVVALFGCQSSGQKNASNAGPAASEPAAGGSSFRIAYFDMDSLEAHYDHFKDAQGQVKAKENSMNMELSSLDRKNQKQLETWRAKGNTMTQAEGEQAQAEYQRMQQEFQSRKTALEQDLYKQTEELKTNIRKEIEDFLKTYNKNKKYAFIFAYDPNSFIYAKDTSYNITPDLLEGLNSSYKNIKK